MFDRQLPYLKPGELPGPVSWNRLVSFLRRVVSRSPRLVINERPGGGAYIDMDIDAAMAGASLDISSKGTVQDSSLTIAAGSVRLPDAALSVASRSLTVSNGLCVFVRVNRGSASIQTDSSFPDIVDTANQRLDIPLGVCTSGGYVHRHVGDIVIPSMPYFWIDNYVSGSAQSLDHGISGGLVWTTYGECSGGEE